MEQKKSPSPLLSRIRGEDVFSTPPEVQLNAPHQSYEQRMATPPTRLSRTRDNDVFSNNPPEVQVNAPHQSYEQRMATAPQEQAPVTWSSEIPPVGQEAKYYPKTPPNQEETPPQPSIMERFGNFVKENPNFIAGATPVLLGFLTGAKDIGYEQGANAMNTLAQHGLKKDLMDYEAKIKANAKKQEAGLESTKPLTTSNVMTVYENGRPVIKRVEEAVGKSPYEPDKFFLNQKKELAKYESSLKAKDERGALKDEQALRKEYVANPVTKNTLALAQSYNTIQGLATAPQTGANDISMIFAYMKMLDPTSVVREGEQATARNAGGIPDAVRLQYNRLIEGSDQLLPPKVRENFLTESRRIYQSQRQLQKQVDGQFSGLAKKYNLDREGVVSLPKVNEVETPMPQNNIKILRKKSTGEQFIQFPDGTMRKMK